jgi:predicted small lipoprotein YifL
VRCLAQGLLIILVAVLGLGQMLSGCGQKGDLYLPEKAKPTAAAAPSASPRAGEPIAADGRTAEIPAPASSAAEEERP